MHAVPVVHGLLLLSNLTRTLSAGFVCADGTVTGSVDEVVCEGGNCTASVLGQGMSIHETGHFIKAWCETSSLVKVERIDVSVCSGRGRLEGKIKPS